MLFSFHLAVLAGTVAAEMENMKLDLEVGPWQAINDGVMGGVSRGRMTATADGLRFEGELSLENNGGFASVRRLVEDDFSAASGVRLRIKGDGRTYQFRLRLDGRFDGVAWRAEFPGSDDWQTIDLPFHEFEPVFRGRLVPDAGPVTPADIRQVGFMLADKTPGPFALEIRAIEFR